MIDADSVLYKSISKSGAIRFLVLCRTKGRKSARTEKKSERNEEIASLAMAGKTLAQIGEVFCISASRVQQVLRKQGIAMRAVKSRAKLGARVARRKDEEERCQSLNGVSLSEYSRLQSNGTVAAYRRQMNSAKCRGISWELDFKSWLSIWTESGKIDESGRGKKKYCMSRNNDSGPYSVANVSIKTNSQNGVEAVSVWAGKTKKTPGVYRMYPGSTRPFIARRGKVNVGRFETEEQAANALAEHDFKNPTAVRRGLGTGKGWALLPGAKSRPYRMQCAGIKSYHATQEEAEAAYKAAVAEIKKQKDQS